MCNTDICTLQKSWEEMAKTEKKIYMYAKTGKYIYIYVYIYIMLPPHYAYWKSNPLVGTSYPLTALHILVENLYDWKHRPK